MELIFQCEHCGRRFQVDDRYQGRKGRCKSCRQVVMIPRIAIREPVRVGKAEETIPAAPAAAPAQEPLFRLSPPEASPRIYPQQPPEFEVAPERPGERRYAEITASRPLVLQPTQEPDYGIELIDDAEDFRAALPVSPQIERGLREMAEFARDPRGYELDTSRSGRGFFSFRMGGRFGPASWIYARWRAAVTVVLRVLRWIDDWAYLISVPFLVLLAVGIIASSTPLAHLGAVVVVLVNYGRFWTDLLALFVRPFKLGPLHGLAFLFPPYGLYFLVTRWRAVKPTLRRMATSCIPIVLVVLAYAFLPSLNPGVETVEGVGPKLEAGKKELIKEIHEGVREIEGRLPSLKTMPKLVPEPKP